MLYMNLSVICVMQIICRIHGRHLHQRVEQHIKTFGSWQAFHGETRSKAGKTVVDTLKFSRNAEGNQSV